MIYQAAEVVGIDQIGIGSDLCQNWGYETLEWMRSGKWAAKPDFGEGSAENANWPKQPSWFNSSRDFMNIANVLPESGFNKTEVEKIMGVNWLKFYSHSFVSSTELTQMQISPTDMVAS
jgi:microsomal dipeptidase-like Zn-dependent dipeptidase